MDKLPEFMSNHTMLFIAAVAVLGLIIFNEIRIRTRGFSTIIPQGLVNWLNQGARVVDIRSESAFNTGHILNAVNLTPDRIEDVERIIKDKSTPIVVSCVSGMTSTRVADQLTKMGYEKVASLSGGVQGWKQDGMPLSK